ncbi:heavy metal-binding domain-containing protein [Mucilaginibacter arboris]|uniref:Heavy metal binding domain-containing protein n=1 Tax=Mucilaginibacter arboris TaxID=2682090 RepID=A0A7K1SU01_9SPHI|nr:heavy metal-binding domain-containing protein [Mucilaginibacter arboris]MVN20795.1 hypothetical protein [Mucilaginibacter arboris]
MKKITLFACLIISVLACNQSNQQTAQKQSDSISAGKNSIQYTCPMHPKIVKNKPGVCPKCGMDLVEKE